MLGDVEEQLADELVEQDPKVLLVDHHRVRHVDGHGQAVEGALVVGEPGHQGAQPRVAEERRAELVGQEAGERERPVEQAFESIGVPDLSGDLGAVEDLLQVVVEHVGDPAADLLLGHREGSGQGSQLSRSGLDLLFERLVGLAQRGLGLEAFRDVGEEDGDTVVRRVAHRERLHPKGAAQRVGGLLEARRLPRLRDPTVGLDPPRLDVGHDLQDGSPHHLAQPRVRFEGRVGLDEPVVAHGPVGVEDHLEDAEPLSDRLEQVVVRRVCRGRLEVLGAHRPAGAGEGVGERIEREGVRAPGSDRDLLRLGQPEGVPVVQERGEPRREVATEESRHAEGTGQEAEEQWGEGSAATRAFA